MSVTATKKKTIQQALDAGSPQELGDAARKMKLGTMLRPIKVTVTGLTAAASFDLTTFLAAGLAQAVPATFTIVGDLPDGYAATKTPLPAANLVKSVRVTASGTAASVGTYMCADSAATPLLPPGGANTAIGIATLSDDGKTITFPNTVTAFVLCYIPRSNIALDTEWAPST